MNGVCRRGLLIDKIENPIPANVNKGYYYYCIKMKSPWDTPTNFIYALLDIDNKRLFIFKIDT
ncbi:hypothetical protein [Caloranaerobacter sp. DY30410]|uniref:hypothetical protein n=1 Tax=Caloranaerobacter sp. DY30410 TaxID=3238305 RepID=UPI003CFCA322